MVLNLKAFIRRGRPRGGPPDSLKGGPMIQQVYSHPDIYRIRVDLPDNPLQYLNAYVIKRAVWQSGHRHGFQPP